MDPHSCPLNDTSCDSKETKDKGLQTVPLMSESTATYPITSESEKEDQEIPRPKETLDGRNGSRTHVVIEEAPRISNNSNRIFGLKNVHSSRKGPSDSHKDGVIGTDGGYISAFDYEKKYPPDNLGEEMAPEARVWKIYLDEAAEDDRFRVENLRDTLDVILVFAGLFSAVVTTFLVHTVESLEENWQMTTTTLLVEIACIQRSIAANVALDTCESNINLHSPNFANPSGSDYAVNVLFFISLAVALCTALAAVLAKQWLHHYVQPIPGNSRDRARRHQFRWQGFTRYRVELIVGLLPIFIHLSLFIFFIGLCIFISTLHTVIAVVVGAITGLSLVLYLASNAIPIFDIQCPYHTPLTTVIHRPMYKVYASSVSALRWCKKLRNGRRAYWARGRSRSASVPLKEVEGELIKDREHYWNVQCLKWLHTTTTDARVHTVACHAFAGIPQDLSDEVKEDIRRPVHASAFEKEFYAMLATPARPDAIERFARAVTLVAPHFPPGDGLSGLQFGIFREFKGGDPLCLIIDDFVVRNLRRLRHYEPGSSILAKAGIYAMAATLKCNTSPPRRPNWTSFPGFTDFLVSLVLHRPKTLHEMVCSHVLALQAVRVSELRSKLTLRGSFSPQYGSNLDRVTTFEFLMKLMALVPSEGSFFISVSTRLLQLILKLLPIEGVALNTLLTSPFESRSAEWGICHLISWIAVLNYMPWPVSEAEVQLFKKSASKHSRSYFDHHFSDTAHFALSAAFNRSVQSILREKDDISPHFWEPALRLAERMGFAFGLSLTEEYGKLISDLEDAKNALGVSNYGDIGSDSDE